MFSGPDVERQQLLSFPRTSAARHMPITWPILDQTVDINVGPPLYEDSENPSVSVTAIIDRIRKANRSSVVDLPLAALPSSHVALDDEAAQDEELYLAGTASERDALILNNLTMGDSLVLPGVSEVPGLRIRVVSPKVSFVFYKTLPYGTDVYGDIGSTWSQVEALVGSDMASDVVDK
jgi:hypothetical protein